MILKKRGGDIAGKLGKLPGTPWAKYSGEKQLSGYSYCEPGTRLDIRLDNQDNLHPVENPINAIDEACRSGDLQQRYVADVKLIHALNSITDKSVKRTMVSWMIKSAIQGKIMTGAGN